MKKLLKPVLTRCAKSKCT